MNALQHILNAAKNVNMAAFDGMTSARKMTILVQLEQARRAVLDTPTATAEPSRVLYPTLQDLVEDGCIQVDVENDYLTEM